MEKISAILAKFNEQSVAIKAGAIFCVGFLVGLIF